MVRIDERFELTDWPAAIPLGERLGNRLLAQVPLPADPESREKADRRLARWRSQAPFGDDAIFARRLSVDGFGEDELHRQLALGAKAWRELSQTPPAWHESFADAFSEHTGTPRAALPWPDEICTESGFLTIVEPLVRHALRQVYEEVAAFHPGSGKLPFDRQTVDRLLLADLPPQLLPMLERTQVLELNVARIEERLVGATARERFQSFVARLGEPDEALRILGEYPVLARQLAVAVEQWRASGTEFLRRLCLDWEAIRETFHGGRNPGPLEQIDALAGDLHRGGRSVRIARFRNGSRLVYKPRSMAVDRHFQELLSWLEERGLEPRLKRLRILDRGVYGWMEFVAARPCRSQAEARRFYRRQGSYLALLHALEATDFHYQNLIADGEHPVLIDLEALFHPKPEGVGGKGLDQLAAREMMDSVLRVGLLPRRTWFVGDRSEGIDLSGLGAVNGAKDPHAQPVAEHDGTDSMRVVRRRLPMTEGRHRPRLDGEALGPEGFIDEILAGFTATYRLLVRHRGDLLAPGGLVDAFAADEVRLIFRRTRIYRLLLAESFHPNLLRDALDRDRHFDRLWVDVVNRPELERILAHEHRDLWQSDIPLFTTRPDSTDVWASSGEIVPGLLSATGLERARRRLEGLGEDDLARQLWFIRTSMAALPGGVEAAVGEASPEVALPEETAGPPERSELLALAGAIAQRLETLALRADSRATWLGLGPLPDGTLSLRALGPELYHGAAGIALFLARFADLTGEERFTRLAREAWSQVRHQVDSGSAGDLPVGAFTGWGSLIWAAFHLAGVWRDRECLSWAETRVEDLAARIGDDRDLDVIGGAAGAVLVLLRLAEVVSGDRPVEVAVECGERLLRLARPAGRGLGWLNRAARKRPLSGLSHGTAGIAWALAELAVETGDERFREAARGALEYERGTFSTTTGDWPDLRFYDERGVVEPGVELPEFFPAWCHGAAGIALSRIAFREHLPDERSGEEIRTAIELTLARGFGHNHSLCHGDFGNLDILLWVSDALGDARLRCQTERVAAGVVADLRGAGCRCGVSHKAEHPGLMTGLAGIGYGLLRLAAPDEVPSILSLDGDFLARSDGTPRARNPVSTSHRRRVHRGNGSPVGLVEVGSQEAVVIQG